MQSFIREERKCGNLSPLLFIGGHGEFSLKKRLLLEEGLGQKNWKRITFIKEAFVFFILALGRLERKNWRKWR
jgi:hypothetical protein